MAEYNVAHAARDRKGDLNVVVQRHIVDRVAERALKTWMDLVELAKAAGDLRAIGADEQPVHLEQTHLGGSIARPATTLKSLGRNRNPRPSKSRQDNVRSISPSTRITT